MSSRHDGYLSRERSSCGDSYTAARPHARDAVASTMKFSKSLSSRVSFRSNRSLPLDSDEVLWNSRSLLPFGSEFTFLLLFVPILGISLGPRQTSKLRCFSILDSDCKKNCVLLSCRRHPHVANVKSHCQFQVLESV
jgi:hypothetical protein